MKRILLPVITFLFSIGLHAQDNPDNEKKAAFANRAGDHLMIQASFDHWTTMPDSISSHQSGFSRGFNVYIMTDKPFKSNPKYSIGLGIGIGSSNISFKTVNVDIKSLAAKLPFTALDSSNHFKRYKLSTSYLEAPVEFRYASKHLEPNKSWKLAVGVKVGVLVNAHTKGVTLEDKNNNTLDSYSEKEKNNKFFNSTRLMATARAGYGILSLFVSYQLNNVIKDVAGPPMKLFQAGITISGL